MADSHRVLIGRDLDDAASYDPSGKPDGDDSLYLVKGRSPDGPVVNPAALAGVNIVRLERQEGCRTQLGTVGGPFQCANITDLVDLSDGQPMNIQSSGTVTRAVSLGGAGLNLIGGTFTKILNEGGMLDLGAACVLGTVYGYRSHVIIGPHGSDVIALLDLDGCTGESARSCDALQLSGGSDFLLKDAATVATGGASGVAVVRGASILRHRVKSAKTIDAMTLLGDSLYDPRGSNAQITITQLIKASSARLIDTYGTFILSISSQENLGPEEGGKSGPGTGM